MRKLLIATLSSAMILGTTTPSSAETDYSQFWSLSGYMAQGMPKDKLLLNYNEAGSDVGATSRIVVVDRESGEWVSTCKTLGEFPCDKETISKQKLRVWAPSLIMPVCADENAADCIVSLTFETQDGKRVRAEFIRYVDGVTYAANQEYGQPATATHALFRAPGVLNAVGTDTYAVEYSQEISWQGTKPLHQQLKATVVPYAEIASRDGQTQELIAGPDPTGGGFFTPDPWNYPGGAIWAEDGVIGKIANHSAEVQVELVVNANTGFGGWLRGRLKSVSFDARQISPTQQRISVTATTVEVPRMAALVNRDEFQKYTDVEVSFFDKHVGGGVGGDAGAGGFGWLDAIRYVSKDTAAGVNRVWMFATVATPSNARCYAVKGIQGMVATNSAIYSGSAPTYSRGFLNYQVAGLHFLPDGTEAIGSYDLVMRSDIARCLYGFSRAPLSASVSIVGEGDRSIATTVVGEKNGWLRLSANGFTFSKKTIRVKLSQKRITITCVSSSQPTKTRKVTGVAPRCPSGFVARR